MKKSLAIIICLLTLTACTKEKENKLDKKYDKVNEEIKEELNNKEEIFNNMQDIDINMLKTEYGLNLNLVENYISGISTTENYKLYIAIKPKTGKEETIKKAMQNYFRNLEVKLEEQHDENGNVIRSEELAIVKNRVEEEFNGYYIYIVSNSNTDILNILKNKLK